MRKRNWAVGPFTQHRAQQYRRLGGTVSRDHPQAVPIEGASIHDRDSGLRYEATVEQADGEVWLTSLTVHAQRAGQRIDAATLRRIPTQTIAEVVSRHLEEQRRSGTPTFVTTADVPDDQEDKRVGTLDEVVASFKEGGTREVMARRVGITVATWDKRIREARDLGLVKYQRKTGRPRAPKTPGPKRSGK